MRCVALLAILLVLVLASCGGPPPDTTVPDPPRSTPLERSDNDKINKLLESWKREVTATMKEAGVKDPIEQKVFRSTATLQEIADFYNQQLTQKNWRQAPNMPGIHDGVLITGYEIDNTTLVISAVDATQLGSSGVIVYIVKGTK
jgi:hypothetical protein